MIDWDLAVSAASRMSGAGPSITRDEAEAVVAELREGAERSTPLVRDYTGLAAGSRTAPVLVVDRPGWIRANADGFAEVIAPLVDKLQTRKGAPSPMAEAVGSRITGLEVGALLGFMSSRVLGQFDPFYGLDSTGESGPAGRLLLVAPNIVHAEREMGVDPRDFRLWVCLHEETHRVQFTAVPWMRDHIRGEIEALVGEIEVDPGKLAAMVGEGVKRVGDILRGDDDVSLLDLFSSAHQREVLDRITAVMSLLEGHADVVMDGVGPEVIPTVKDIRRRFTERRKGTSYLDRVLRKLLGLDAKMAQYRDGAAFTRGVLDQVGMEGFNAVWAEPANLPSRVEIADPAAWVRRVHG
ncbi:coenzyme F420 biosynthesis-associated protein [Nocardioides iriomotensis]|uniref:Coenzyme F420 biosynthesis-associated protein n=2 Tax=Nocardioides iriomotensis TaxID=715784 RepID=A0A4Q5JA30_9ACTN|nr:coenzyme F420 biosynthesis-associated protein [Nocardioides iriomotensis]